jgi:hypothetical protein
LEKDAAEKAAKRVYGVRGVANDIEIKLPSSRADPEIAMLFMNLTATSVYPKTE